MGEEESELSTRLSTRDYATFTLIKKLKKICGSMFCVVIGGADGGELALEVI